MGALARDVGRSREGCCRDGAKGVVVVEALVVVELVRTRMQVDGSCHYLLARWWKLATTIASRSCVRRAGQCTPALSPPCMAAGCSPGE